MRPLLLAAALLGLAAPLRAQDLTIFAAASLKTALDEIATTYEQATGLDVAVSYAGSSILARQIIQGAPADIFISANPEWMDEVEAAGLLATGSRRDLLGNSIVLISHGAARAVAIGPGLDLPALLGNGRLAMALVDAVPAGIYGKAALGTLGLWDEARPLVAQTDNVRAALALVAAGEAPLGIVYATDAAATDAVSIIGVFPPDSHPPVVYPAAALATARPHAAQFLAFLESDPAQEAFLRQGFTLLAQ